MPALPFPFPFPCFPRVTLASCSFLASPPSPSLGLRFPGGPERPWLLMSGRGAGSTRSGAEDATASSRGGDTTSDPVTWGGAGPSRDPPLTPVFRGANPNLDSDIPHLREHQEHLVEACVFKTV